MSNFSGVSSEELRLLIEKIEHLESEKADIIAQVRETMEEAKHQGFEPKIVRQVIKLRKMDRQARVEQEALLELYLEALGMHRDVLK